MFDLKAPGTRDIHRLTVTFCYVLLEHFEAQQRVYRESKGCLWTIMINYGHDVMLTSGICFSKKEPSNHST